MSEIRSLNGYPLADTTARESISQLGSDINGIKNNYVSSGQLTQAVEDALQVAKDSGSFDGPAGADGAKGDPGKDGTSVKISSIVESQEPGGANEVTFSDGNRLSVKNGSNGTAGANGVGIQSVVQTTTSTTDGGSNVITVTKTDGKKSTFTVKNGSKGSAGADGASGKDGYTPVKGKDYFDGVSPTVTITTITGGHRVSITDANGTKSFDVMNGSEISDTKLAEAIAAYIAENPIEGGVDEEQLAQAVETALQTAKDSGEFDGKDGVSITVTSVKESNVDGAVNVVTFSDGKTVTIKNGNRGADGKTPVKGVDYVDGTNGVGIQSVVQTTTSNADGGSNVITVTKTDGTKSTFTVKNGNKGADGRTPEKGVDYYTPDEKTEMLDTLAEELPTDGTFIGNVADQVKVVKVAEHPEFVNDISECVDTSKMYVLPNGHLAAYMKTEVTTEGSTKPAYNNLVPTLIDFDKSIYNGKGYKENTRISGSSGTSDRDGYITFGIMPFVKGDIIRTKGINWISDKNAGNGDYSYVIFYTDALDVATNGSARNTTVTDGVSSIASFGGIVFSETDGVFTFDTTNWDNTAYSQYTYLRICGYGNGDELIVTKNQKIKDIVTPGGTEIVTEWTDTGIEYNQPPDYSQRVTALESKTTKLGADVDALQTKVNSCGGTSASGMDAFAYAAYPPSPQLPGDGSDKADFNTDDVKTSEIYAYMDALWSRYRTYMVRQNLGKDSSGQYDYYRYVFSKAYWRAWYKENYPKMYAWKSGSTVIYSVSVSPRVGDTMYSTPHIGTVYKSVTAVNSETIGVASTRTVNGLVFKRYAAGDVEPTIVYTTPFSITANYKGRTYTDTFAAASSVKEFAHEYIVDSNDVKYYRYPFEDKKLDKTKLFSVFILANEHGNHGDSMIPCVTVLRMLTDLCGNADVQFLRWLKENAVVTVIPVGNPYGTYRNANSVNINRNYDTPGWAGSDTDPQGGTKEDGDFGPYAGSEIETQYIMNTIQQCKAQAAVSYHGRGIPEDSLIGEYNSHGRFQGCGFNAERMWKVEEALFTMYNFSFGPDWHTIPDETHNNYLNAGKSPSYIEYAGAVGGLIEIDDYEVGTHDCFTPLAMEQAYAEVLLVLQNWCEEALLKEG